MAKKEELSALRVALKLYVLIRPTERSKIVLTINSESFSQVVEHLWLHFRGLTADRFFR